MTPPLAAWGLHGTPVARPGGHRNTVLRVGAHVLKTSRRCEAALRWLGPVQDIVEAQGLAVPRLIAAANGMLCVNGWTCEPFLPGLPTPPARISAAMTALHDAARILPPRPDCPGTQILQSKMAGGDVDLNIMPEPLVTALRAAWAELPAARTAIHGDLNASNILTGQDGRIALIDWDEARQDSAVFDRVQWSAASPIEKRAALAWEIACCWQAEPARARALAADFVT